jgi:hypothetical protein
LISRKIAAGLAAVFIPCQQSGQAEYVIQAEEMLEQGNGLIVLMNHFSLRDPLQVTSWLFRNKVTGRRPIIAPVAYHRHDLILRFLCYLMAIETYPIATLKTIRLGYDVPERGAAVQTYLESAVSALEAGSIVFIAPQGGRKSRLRAPVGHPVGSIITLAEQKCIHNYGILILGLSVPGATSYDQASVRGLNVFRKYGLGISQPYRADEAVELAGGIDSVDAWIFGKMAELLPAAYRDLRTEPSGPAILDRSASTVD